MGIYGRIFCSLQDVSLSSVLRSGQSFRWVKMESGEWVGPLGRYLWILRQDETGVDFRVLSAEGAGPGLQQVKAQAIIEDYFQLSVSLPDLYRTWSAADPAFKSIGGKLPGVRMLRQDPVENLFCFICSSNNNIQRITSMVEKLCERYGEPICEYGGRAFHAFPTVSALAAADVEPELRQLGFGYRARFIGQTAQQLAERGGEAWLLALRRAAYRDCHAELRQLCGVGAKVADCVCLMSLDQAAAVPVDTHVHQLAARHYLPHLRSVKSLTDRAYREVADHFRKVFGERAGWAQAVLFCGDLNEFKTLPDPPLTAKKTDVRPAKAGKSSNQKSGTKKSARSASESVTIVNERAPLKRSRTCSSAKETSLDAIGENTGSSSKVSRAVSTAEHRSSRRSKRQQVPST
ncbi:N-glycosylase/DNA lyase-like [Amphibalanus amphitrite]|uniref:N-glycosylase/DNA lyase-like n=1 Tax=Amphibalanus amphitrite TaxID=1232801 RepID=UPI001C9233EC|nr:N-glycosylase/DNA lyase-like [Amphibalanus amphitrite]